MGEPPQDAELEPVFRALADPTRRAILARLAAGPLPVHHVAAAFAATRPAISRHLRVLREAGLVRERRRGRERVYELEPGPVGTVRQWLAGIAPGGRVAHASAPPSTAAADRPTDRRAQRKASHAATAARAASSARSRRDDAPDWAPWRR